MAIHARKVLVGRYLEWPDRENLWALGGADGHALMLGNAGLIRVTDS